SRFPFLTKLCFSKWSEIKQKPSDLTTLRFSSVPRTPWLLHKSEHGVPTTEFPLSCTTIMNGGGDCMWTLWVISGTHKHFQQHQHQTPLAVQESVVEESAVSVTDAATDCDSTCPSDLTVRRNLIAANNSDSVIDIIDILRNRLCDIRNDRGDAASSAESQLGDA
ncbi:Heterogeneous nuclear ribonucleoprotein L, partial [Aphis craccivora]